MVAAPHEWALPPSPTEELEDAIAGIAHCLRILLKVSRQGTLFNLTQGDTLMIAQTAASAATAEKSSTPRYDVFVVENYEDGAGSEKSSWTRLGVAFPHKDTKGFNVELRAIPVNGKLVIRLHEPNQGA